MFLNSVNALKCYIVGDKEPLPIDVEDFLPAVGYIDNGKITDFMYDSFIILPQPDYLYDHSPGGTGQRKPLKKAKWQEYLDREAFLPGKNMDALEKAVGIVKQQLGVTDYKANVFLSLFYPHILVHDFGKVDGRNLDLSHMDARKAALKWMVDASIARFRSRQYEHIRIGGFYWFAENIVPGDKNEEFLPYITDYIRSLGYQTIWSVWYNAPGHELWRELGFDAVGYQPNFFPEHRKDWPNRGTEERLGLVTDAVQRFGFGVEIEMADFADGSAEVVKQYYSEGRRAGWTGLFRTYYMSTGPKLIRRLAETDQPLLHDVYNDTYRFIRK